MSRVRARSAAFCRDRRGDEGGAGDPRPSGVLRSVIDDRLAAHLRTWLGRWPGTRPGLTVVGWPARDEPGWDGGLHRVIGVTAPGHGVLSVPPASEAAVAAWVDGGGEPAGIPAAAGVPGRWFDGVFRWSDRPAPLSDAGEWIAADHPSVPPWLRPFGGQVLVAVDEVTGVSRPPQASPIVAGRSSPSSRIRPCPVDLGRWDS
jgi:hypothetical protein